MFWQIHRGTVINVNAIAGVVRDIGGCLSVKFKDRKETLQVSEALPTCSGRVSHAKDHGATSV